MDGRRRFILKGAALAHMLVVEDRVAGREQVDHAEAVPFGFLEPYRAHPEDVSQDHIEEHHHHHQEHQPGDAAAEALLERNEPIA